MHAFRFTLLAGGLLVLAGPARATAQLQPPATGGLVALHQELRMLGTNRRVLMIGAHPDDEDTELLTLLVRGMGAEAAYLSLNRGEGGQNLIGPELGEALGLIRSEELLAARRLDGAGQFFTRAYDYGYSKSLDEAWRFWPRDSILKDVLAVVRAFRPQVIVSIFTGTARDGHGQHQAAGWVARRAFEVAGDSTVFPQAGAPWRPLKLYRSTRFDSAATTLRLEGGRLDPWIGQSYHQVAMRGRSMHRSQDMGQLQTPGPSAVRLQLVEDRTGSGGTGLFAGVDTTFTPARRWPGVGEALKLVDSVRQGALGRGTAELLRRAAALSEPYCASEPGSAYCARLHRAGAIARGLVLDVIASDDRIVPGQELTVTLHAWNGSDRGERVVLGLAGLGVRVDSAVTIPAGAVVSWPITFRVPPGTPLTNPYYLELPRTGAIYRWPPDGERGLPFERPPLTGTLRGEGVAVAGEAVYRERNQELGEVRRPLVVVPGIEVRLEPGSELWSTRRRPHDFTVTLANHGTDSARGQLTLELPPGWSPPPEQAFALGGQEERETFTFTVTPPEHLVPGRYRIRAVATTAEGTPFSTSVFTVDYPHIRSRSWTEPAEASVTVSQLELPRLGRVGYIRGASDRVPEALASVGVPVELLDRTTLEHGDLSRFDVIVIGSRAYETDPALVENNSRLLRYARDGGVLIVQYQQHQFFRGGYAPYPMTVGGQPLVLDSAGGSRVGPPVSHDRVTDETAPVRIIAPESPVVNLPNRIGAADWLDWVQERGLYFAHTWDDAYRPVLEIADPGEAPLRGGLLVARYGEGTYVYTGLSFFRELPAGVPGAFRLFANLLALGEGPQP